MNLKRVAAHTFSALSLVIMVAALTFTILVKINNKSLNDLFINGYKISVVSSSSMAPELEKGAIVVVKKASFDEIMRKDVIAFRIDSAANTIALHRVIDIQPDGFITKGDANESPDGRVVTKSNLIGKKVLHTNIFASYIRSIQTRRGLIINFVLPFIGLFSIYATIKLLPHFMRMGKQETK